MKLKPVQAALLTARERALVESSGPWQVKDLVKTIQRTRELRDKYRQLSQRQDIALSRQGGRPAALSGKANARTRAKASLLDRALKGFEAALLKLDAESTRAARDLQIGGERTAAAAAPSKAVKASAKAPGKGKATQAGSKSTVAKKVAVKKDAAKKGAAKKAMVARAALGKPDVGKAVSSKARQPLPKSVEGPTGSRSAGSASRRTRAKKSRRG